MLVDLDHMPGGGDGDEQVAPGATERDVCRIQIQEVKDVDRGRRAILLVNEVVPVS